MSMTAADLLYGLVFQLTHGHLQRLWPTFICPPFYMINWACQISSVVFLLLLNMDKFVYIAFPLHYNMWITDTLVYAVAAAAWLFIVLVCTFSWFGKYTQHNE